MERVRYRWWAVGMSATIVAGAAVWATVSAVGEEERSGGGTTECEVSRLRGPDAGAKLRAEAVSPSGEYIVGSSDEDVVLWRDGEPEIVKDVDSARAVNSDGVIAGERGEDESAWRYRDGEVTELDAPVDGELDVSGINESGDIVGTVRDADAENDVGDGDPVSSRGFPMLWPDGAAEPVELEVEKDKRAWAEAVTADGTVLGYQVDNGTDDPWPWRWNSEGEGEKLPRSPADENDSVAVPVDVAGDWVLSANAPDGYRWKLSDPDKAERVRLHHQSAVAVDAEGGVYGLAEWNVAGRQIGDEVLPLPRLGEGGEAYDAGTTTAVAAGDDGTVVIGSAADEDGTSWAVTWTCG